MTDEAAFLRAIIERPDDDVPRLVYADWLDERGQPERAEFIRVQCRIAELTDACSREDCGCPRCLEIAAGRRREFDLWTGGAGNFGGVPGDWFPTIYGSIHPPGVKLTRGFVSEVRCSWADWSRHAAALLAACPIANSHDGLVRLTTWPEWETPSVEGEYDYRDDRLRFPGGRWHHIPMGGLLPTRGREMITQKLLAAEYPGVQFELPAAGDWDAPARSTPLADIRALQDRVRSLGRPVVPHLRPGVAFRAGLVHADPAIFQVTPEARP